MKLVEVAEALTEAIKKDPKLGDLIAVFSLDDEGNNFKELEIEGLTKGSFFKEDKDFISEEHFEEWGYSEDDTDSVCLN